MAEYSAEYIKNNSWENLPDFSILEIFSKLSTGESIELICEGYGFVKISNINNNCMLIFLDGTSKSFEDLINSNSF
ncbi:MAG: hypothetical protein RI922_1003 [Bacteroidota bacterium]|jgi:hypothetical protein